MSLKQAAKERLLWAIKQVVVPFGRVIMLVDPKSLKTVSACCSVSDLLDEGVELVELLTKKREPLRGKNVLCMLSDDLSYLDLLLSDFVKGKERYLGVFVLFNCHLRDDSALRRIAREVSFDRILGCFELHLNFVAFESRVFFTQNYSFAQLHNLLTLSSIAPLNTGSGPGSVNRAGPLSPSSWFGASSGPSASNGLSGQSSSPTAQNAQTATSLQNAQTSATNTSGQSGQTAPSPQNTQNTTTTLDDYVSRTASKIASVCSALNVLPKISFLKNSHLLTARVAHAVEGLLQATADRTASTNSELLIFDRSLDFSPAFIHEYTYQAFVYDLVEINYCTYEEDAGSGGLLSSLLRRKTQGAQESVDNCFKYTFVSSANREEERQALLDPEQDAQYAEYRHMHIQQVNTRVSQEINKFSELAAGRPRGEASMQSTLQLVRSIPEYQQAFEKVWAHFRLSERCFKFVESSRLIRVGMVEQMIATNTDSGGKHVSHSKCHEKLLELLADELEPRDKLRLVLLYLANYQNLGRAPVVRLLAQLPREALELFRRLVRSVPLTNLNIAELLSGDLRAAPEPAADKKELKPVHRIEKGEMHSYYKKVHVEYELSRYLSEVIFVVLQFVNNQFAHPLLQPTKAQPAPDKRSKTDELESFNLLFRKGADERKKLIVYVLGGLSLSECREAYKLSERKGVDVFIGGDEILIPSKVLDQFSQ